jgi:hypothetical protein
MKTDITPQKSENLRAVASQQLLPGVGDRIKCGNWGLDIIEDGCDVGIERIEQMSSLWDDRSADARWHNRKKF